MPNICVLPLFDNAILLMTSICIAQNNVSHGAELRNALKHRCRMDFSRVVKERLRTCFGEDNTGRIPAEEAGEQCFQKRLAWYLLFNKTSRDWLDNTA